MTRVNITVPDELLAQAKAAGLNVSRVSAAALSQELDRRAKIAALDNYLRELESELGPVAQDDQAEARQWAERVLGHAGQPLPGRETRTA